MLNWNLIFILISPMEQIIGGGKVIYQDIDGNNIIILDNMRQVMQDKKTVRLSVKGILREECSMDFYPNEAIIMPIDMYESFFEEIKNNANYELKVGDTPPDPTAYVVILIKI